MFFVGSGNLLLAMLWWALWLIAVRWPGVLGMPMAVTAPGWMHAVLMQYLVLPSFFFGFLMTVFPRWMNVPELARWHYLPTGIGLLCGQLFLLAAALGFGPGLGLGLALALMGWGWGLFRLGRLLWAEKGRTWHARSCFAAMALGGMGLVLLAVFALTADARWMFFSIKLGGFGLLLPVYLTVAHRMFPFFAGNVVAGYVPWRPVWVLGLIWLLLLAHLLLEVLPAPAWLWLADVPMCVLALYTLWRWWPRGKAPGLLKVLFWGLAWWPLAFALYALQSLMHAFDGSLVLGRGPAHALFIGLFGSLLVAMVTRVTQGHSGRALTMYPLAWLAFWGMQAIALVRVLAEALPDTAAWQALAGAGWVVMLVPWLLGLGRTYLAPRVDGKPG